MRVGIVVGGFAIAAACTTHNPRACLNGECTDPSFPFCDLDGTLGGEAGECIAVSCMPMQFAECRGNDALTCNASGNNYDSSQCESSCDPTQGCVTPQPPRTLYVLFTSDRDGNSEIYRMNPDGSVQTNLTNNGASDTSPLWDPTGERIAFLSDRSGTQELYVMAEDGANVLNVSKGQAQEPAWAPDGTQLVFTSTRTGEPEIYKVNANGGLVLALTGIGMAGTGEADWAPDGNTIVFQTKALIYSMNSDGTGQMAISQNPLGGDSFPRWSPNGTLIAFSRRLSFENFDIFVMGPGGGSPVDITTAQTTTYENTVNWSPDGAHVAGQVEDGNEGDPMFGTGVYVVGANGSSFAEIEFPPSSHPCWSPDSSSLIYELDRTGSQQIYQVPIAGGAAANLTNATGNNTQCSVRPR